VKSRFLTEPWLCPNLHSHGRLSMRKLGAKGSKIYIHEMDQTGPFEFR
jgi:hypothetical protein